MLTQSQRKTYHFIKEFIEQHGFSPTAPEIAEGIHIKSTGVVHRYVHAIAKAGLIRIIPRRHRGIELLEEIQQSWELPLLGKIAAGLPIEAIPEQSTLDLGAALLGPDRFALLVKGDSMIEAGIFDGDYVICQQEQVANDKDIAVVLINNEETTLKYFHDNHDGTITLIPANKALKPMTYHNTQIMIQGIVVGQLRSYR